MAYPAWTIETARPLTTLKVGLSYRIRQLGEVVTDFKQRTSVAGTGMHLLTRRRGAGRRVSRMGDLPCSCSSRAYSYEVVSSRPKAAPAGVSAPIIWS